jgi:hypothetical protein
MNEPEVPQNLLDLAATAQASPELVARACGTDENLAVAPGQLWRTAWEHTSVLVIVMAARSSNIIVAPLTVDPPAEDETCLVIARSATIIDAEMTLWIELECDLPLRVFDTLLDQLAPSFVDSVCQFTKLTDFESPLIRRGRSADSIFSSVNDIKADLIDDLDELRQSPTLPVRSHESATPSLETLLGKGFKVSKLAADLRPLGLDQSAVMDLVRGKRPVTPEEAEVVATSTGTPAEVVLQAVQPFPADFVAEVERPYWRSTWRVRAKEDHVDETTARLRESYDMFARAARETGTTEPNWAARLAQFRSRTRSRQA